MRKLFNNFKLATFIFLAAITCFNCSVADDESTERATITINLILPAGINAAGKTWEIIFTSDISNLSAGNFDYYTTGTCGSGTTVIITLTDVDPDAYYLFATIYMGTMGPGGPQAGDCVGVYGVTNPEDLTTPNATVPASGTVTFTVSMFEM